MERVRPQSAVFQVMEPKSLYFNIFMFRNRRDQKLQISLRGFKFQGL